jgi:hypothetical protein
MLMPEIGKIVIGLADSFKSHRLHIQCSGKKCPCRTLAHANACLLFFRYLTHSYHHNLRKNLPETHQKGQFSARLATPENCP